MVKRIRKITLVLPNALWSGVRRFNIHPYSLCILASVLRNRYEVVILDANLLNLSPEEAAERIAMGSPDVVGVSCMSIEYAKAAHLLAKLVKEKMPQVITVLGGVYPTVLPEFALKDEHFDYLILSEGEYRFRRLLEAIESGYDCTALEGTACRNGRAMVINPVTDYIDDLDSIPLPAYDLVDFSAYANQHNQYSLYNNPRVHPYAVTVTSRGCPFDCVFCSSKTIQGRKCRMRSSENVLREIDWLVQQFHIQELIFLDDNLMLDRNRVIRILTGLIERNYGIKWKATNVPTFFLDEELLTLMKQSGCYQITLPIESGNEHVLKEVIHKPLKLTKAREVIDVAKRLDLEIASLFVIGLPGETWDQILDTIRFADEIDVDWVAFSIATPLPQTDLFKLAREKGFIDPKFDFSDFEYFGFGHGSISTDEFTPSELQMLRAIEWDRINFKTKEKQETIARMNSITLDEVHQWRVSTRRNCGVNVQYKNRSSA